MIKLIMIIQWVIVMMMILTTVSGKEFKSPPVSILNSHDKTTMVRDDIFIVEFDPVETKEECLNYHQQFRDQLSKIHWLERRSFCTLFNGISFHITASTIPSLITLPHVKAIWPMVSKILPNYSLGNGESTSDPRDNYIMTGVTKVHEQLRLDGTGIKVGVIDTGIDYTHPHLGGCFKKPGCKVMFGKDLVGDSYDGELNGALPDDDPRDICGGHGTHVAGIIGANGPEFKGVAPNVTLGAYRVFGCGPKARVESDIIIEAMELAYQDGMDIVNLSLGGGSAWADYPDSMAAEALTKKGVLVIAASGNDGDKGMWKVASPAISKSVISATSFDSEKFMARAFTVANLPDSRIDYTIGTNSTRFNVTNVTAIQASDPKMLGCTSNDSTSIIGKVLIVKRGSCSFQVKANLAQRRGAIALIVINNNPGTFTPLLSPKTNLTIPVVGVSNQMGNLIITTITKDPYRSIVITTPPSFVNPNGGHISSFSSWGPGPELEMKPDLGAPGGMIFSTFPVPLGMYATLSGTSMATPYTTGVAALYLQSHPKHTPDMVRVALQNSCQPAMDHNSTLPTTVTRQGAGMINAYAAITSRTEMNPSRLLLNQIKSNFHQPSQAFTTEFNITNHGPTPLTYRIEHLPTPAVSSHSEESLLPTPRHNEQAIATLAIINQSKFKLNPGQTRQVQVHITPPRNLSPREYWFFSGYLRLYTDQPQLLPLHLPYLGLMGDYSRLPILANATESYPKLQRHRDNRIFNTTTMAMDSFTFHTNDTLTLQVRIEHPTKLLTITVIDADTQDELGYIVGGINFYVSRNDNHPNNKYYLFPWSGECLRPTPPSTSSSTTSPPKLTYQPFHLHSGRIQLKVSALRPLGSPSLPSHYQTWLSPLLILSPKTINSPTRSLPALPVPLVTSSPSS